MSVADTSLAAYHDPENSSRRMTQRDRVYHYIVMHPNSTNRQIANALGLEHSTVAGRVNELKKRDLVLSGGVRDGARVVRAIRDPEQLELLH